MNKTVSGSVNAKSDLEDHNNSLVLSVKKRQPRKVKSLAQGDSSLSSTQLSRPSSLSTMCYVQAPTE